MSNVIEFYEGDKFRYSFKGVGNFHEGNFINIEKVTYIIRKITFCLDHTDAWMDTVLRCNVDIERVTP